MKTRLHSGSLLLLLLAATGAAADGVKLSHTAG